jgi:hypothetical protein
MSGHKVVGSGVAQQILPSSLSQNVTYIGELSGSGSVVNTTTEEGPSYAFVNRQRDILTSSYLPSAPCRCGTRNPDNRCVSGLEETMPFESTTAASTVYFDSLWNNQPYMLITPTDRAMMLREAPLALRPQAHGPMGV